ncbi:hypothetical protein ASC80_19300 [Afipia sp. Root123D2]|uniref:hypothetical protein n=1 Tax=Afipia sp. Root123D2 TaxID=1736436 RepID=UPI0007002DF6|nr:hypothetical protein [Afipia sp. Root123D2]KQW19504.1 hypothetical protein ASC80_19300 [Afipia sp. Root123D2]
MGWERIGLDGEVFTPHRYPNGLYRVADPALGDVKHHAKNQLSIRDDQIEDYLQRGFSLRMKGDVTGKVNLIPPSEIRRV